MPPVGRGEGENPRKTGQLVCGTPVPPTLLLLQGSVLVLILLHGVASIPHQPAPSPLCPTPGAPQCPELTRSRAHLPTGPMDGQRSCSLPFPHPLGSSTAQGSPRLGPGHALPGTLSVGKLWREMAPLTPEEGPHSWSAAWSVIPRCSEAGRSALPAMGCRGQGPTTRSPGTGLAGSRTGQ